MDPIFFALALLSVSSFYFAWRVSRNRWFEKTIVAFLTFVFQVLLTGYVGSFIGEFGDPSTWLALTLLSAAAVAFVAFRSAKNNTEEILETQCEPVAKPWPLLILLGGTVAFIAISNLWLILSTAPHNFDSQTCHLARTAHFLQQRSLDWYPCNMWAQTSHPRNHPILLAFVFRVGGENATQMLNWIAWLMSGVIVFGTVANVAKDQTIAWITSLLSLLLVNGIMISTTTQNDLVMATHVGASIYLLSAYRSSGRKRYVLATAIPLFVCFGIKASSLFVVPSFLIVAAFMAYERRTQFKEKLSPVIFSVAASLAIAIIFAIPTGYIQNFYRHDHPLGVEHVRTAHTLEGLPLADKAAVTGKNALRYALDSTSFEGVKHNGKLDAVRQGFVALVGKALQAVGCDLEDSEFSKHPFHLKRLSRNHEDYSWWGVAGVLLIWPSLIICWVSKSDRRFAKVFAIAFVLFLIFQGHAQYDPWRGRYFAWASVLVMIPVASMIISLLQGRAGQTFLMVVAVAMCVSSTRAVYYRTNSYLIDKNGQTSVFKMDRGEQLSRNLPEMAAVIREFEKQVPLNATVAVGLSGRHFFYPWYGSQLTRKIVHVRPNPKGLEEGEQAADYLLFSTEEGKLQPKPGDILLGQVQDRGEIYLRASP